MIDDTGYMDLKEIVEDIDKKVFSDHYYLTTDDEYLKYDYRKFNLKTTNSKLKGLVLVIKNGYEVNSEN